MPAVDVATLTPSSSPVALYDTMCRAIDTAYAVDEVKRIRDKAIAWEVYSRQAKNIEAERRACQIRLRAERKAGRLLTSMEKAKGGRPTETNATTASVSTLKDIGVTPRQSSDWQKLGAVPEDQFEAALDDPTHKPTTSGIIRDAKPPDPDRVPVSRDALWLWGRLRDFEADGLLAKPVIDVLLTMTPEMLDDVHRLAPRVSDWLYLIGAPIDAITSAK